MTLWQCPNVAMADGLFTKVVMLAIGLLFAIASLAPDFKIRGALSRQAGTPATPIARVLFFFIGCLLIFQAARLLLLCN